MVRDKWVHYRIMKKDSRLLAALPDTMLMGKGNVQALLNKYEGIFLKPRRGYHGYGVIQVLAKPNRTYELHSEHNRKIYRGIQPIYSFRRFHHYIVQQRIPLLTIKGKPFDIRVMVQRNSKSPWTVTGLFAKVAARGYVITNAAGMIMKAEEALQRCILKPRRQEVLSRIHAISLRAARRLHHSFPGLRTVGLDVGLDRRGEVWIIEVNFKPDIAPFLLFKDKTMYRKIMRYKRLS